MRVSKLGWVAALLLSVGCAGESESKASVAGKWCGAKVTSPEACVGDEIEYLDLRQAGTQVTGKICEAYEKDCFEILNGTLSDAHFTFTYSPDFIGGRADFQLNDDQLQGQIHADKCGCEVPFTLHRL